MIATRSLVTLALTNFIAMVFMAHQARAGDEGDPEIRTTEGIVEQVQAVDATAVGSGHMILVVLDDGSQFHFPDTDHLASGDGVRLEIAFLSSSEDDAPPVACSARVLAMPLEIDGETVMQEAHRPFSVYQNPDPACDR